MRRWVVVIIIMLPIFTRVPKNTETGMKVLESQSQKMRVEEKEEWEKKERERGAGKGRKESNFNSMFIISTIECSVSRGFLEFLLSKTVHQEVKREASS